MSLIYLKSVLNKRNLLKSFLIVGSLLVFENIFARIHWIEWYNTIKYDAVDNAVIFTFKVYDYKYGPFDEDGYIRWCDFSYSTDGSNFTKLFRIETDDQAWTGRHATVKNCFLWTWLNMMSKREGAQIQFLGNMIKPVSGTIWPENEDVHIEVINDHKPDYQAHMIIKWFLNTPDTDYQHAKYIKLIGFWKVNGIYSGDDINAVYEIPGKEVLKSNTLSNSPSTLKSDVLISKNNPVKISYEGSSIVIRGAELGENIKVYNVSGVEVKSIVANNEVIILKLDKNLVYIVKVGQFRYKVVL